MKNKALIFISILAFISSCISTDVDVSSGLTGVVIDSDTSSPLSGCIVSIMPGNRSVSTNSEGFFDFGTLDMGEYTVIVSLKDYGKSVTEVKLEALKPSHIEIALTKATIPVISTAKAQKITGTGALLSGAIISDGGNDLLEVGFYYGMTTDTKQKVIADIDEDSLFRTITDLLPTTQYYYKAYARNSIGESCGEIQSFITTERQLSEVTTLDATNITTSSATLAAKIESDEKGLVVCGFYVGTSEMNMAKHFIIIGAILDKKFVLEIKNLTPCTQYYYRAFISDEKNENVGSIKTFTTKM